MRDEPLHTHRQSLPKLVHFKVQIHNFHQRNEMVQHREIPDARKLHGRGRNGTICKAAWHFHKGSQHFLGQSQNATQLGSEYFECWGISECGRKENEISDSKI